MKKNDDHHLLRSFFTALVALIAFALAMSALMNELGVKFHRYINADRFDIEE